MNELPGVDAIKREQQQELFECIRHFSKYKGMGMLNPALAMPESGKEVEEGLTKLYEDVFEK